MQKSNKDSKKNDLIFPHNPRVKLPQMNNSAPSSNPTSSYQSNLDLDKGELGLEEGRENMLLEELADFNTEELQQLLNQQKGGQDSDDEDEDGDEEELSREGTPPLPEDIQEDREDLIDYQTAIQQTQEQGAEAELVDEELRTGLTGDEPVLGPAMQAAMTQAQSVPVPEVPAGLTLGTADPDMDSEEEVGEELDEDFEEAVFGTGNFFQVAAASTRGPVIVTRTEIVQRLATSKDNEANLDALAQSIGDLLDLQYSKSQGDDRAMLLETYLGLIQKTIKEQQRPKILQNVPPLVQLYHDGKFVQPWLKPVTGDLKLVFSEDRERFGERVFTERPTGPDAVLQTLDYLSTLVNEKMPDRLNIASDNIASALRSYFIDSSSRPTINANRVDQTVDRQQVLRITPIGKNGEYILDVYRFEDEMNQDEELDFSKPTIVQSGEDEEIVPKEYQQNQTVQVKAKDNRDYCFVRAHELEIPRYVNQFIEGLFKIKEREDPLERRRGRGRQTKYDEKTPFIERIIRAVNTDYVNPTIKGQEANVRGFLREPLITTPSAFQIWYMREIQSKGENLSDPQKVWLSMSVAETAPYFQEYYVLREEHFRKSKLLLVPYDVLMQNPEKFSITRTWTDTYIIFLLPQRPILTYDQALRETEKFYPGITELLKNNRVEFADIMSNRKEKFDPFISLNRDRRSEGVGAEQIPRNVLYPLTPERQAQFDQAWPTLTSFLDYIEFLKVIIGDSQDIVTIHQTLRLPTITNGDNNSNNKQADERIPRYSLFSLDTLLDQFSTNISHIDPKLLQYIKKPARAKFATDQEALKHRIEDINNLLNNPGKVNGLRAPNRAPNGSVSQPGSGLNTINFLADDKLFLNEFVTKAYGKYPFFVESSSTNANSGLSNSAGGVRTKFIDGLEARIHWIMHTPDQGNLFFEVNYYNDLIDLLREIDPRLVPGNWDESQAINYHELLIHIESLGADVWPIADRINVENWKQLVPLQNWLNDVSPVARYMERIAALDQAIETNQENAVNAGLSGIRYQGLYYLPWYLTNAKNNVPANLNEIGIWHNDDKRYYDRNTYLLLFEKQRVNDMIKHYSAYRGLYMVLPALLKDAYESVLQAQNKCIGLAIQATRPRLVQTLEVQVQDYEVVPQKISQEVKQLRQIESIEDEKRLRDALLAFFENEGISDGEYLYTKKGERLRCIHYLEVLRMPREAFLDEFADNTGHCRICGVELVTQYDDHSYDKRMNRPDRGEGEIMINPEETDDDRLLGNCIDILESASRRRATVNLENLDPNDRGDQAMARQLELDAMSQHVPGSLPELDNWICQMVKYMISVLSAAPTGTTANSSSGALRSLLETESTLNTIINEFQDAVLNSPIDLTDLVTINEEEIVQNFPQLVQQKMEADAAIAKQQQSLTKVQADLEKITDKKSQQALVLQQVIKKLKAVPAVQERYQKNIENTRRTLRFDKFVTRYIQMLESIVDVLMSVQNMDPREVRAVLNDLNLLLNDYRIARFAISYRLDNASTKAQQEEEQQTSRRSKKATTAASSTSSTSSARPSGLFPGITEDALVGSALLNSENRGATIKERVENFIASSKERYNQLREVWDETKRRYQEMGRLADVESNFYYSARGFEQEIPPEIMAAITSTDNETGLADLQLPSLDLSYVTQDQRGEVEELQKFLGQQINLDYRELYRMIDETLAEHTIMLNEKNLARANVKDCYTDMRTFYFQAIMELLRNGNRFDLITESELILNKLQQVVTEDFMDKLRTVYNRILLIRFYSNQLFKRYNELIVHNQSITPNDSPYNRSTKTTYIDMAIGASHTEDIGFPPDKPILTEEQLEIVREPQGSDEGPNTIPDLTTWLSTRISRDLSQQAPRQQVVALIERIGGMPDRRREELLNGRNKFFEGAEETLLQIYLNTIQLLKNLNINYSRYYHSLLANWKDFEKLLETYPQLQQQFPFDETEYDRLRRVLTYFNPELSNSLIDRTYVYRSQRYGNRELLASYGSANPIQVATSIQDQSDEWIPSQGLISRKLTKFLLDNIDDATKCYQSMKPEDAIDAETLRRFLKYTLLRDIYETYAKLEANNLNSFMPVYSGFVFKLLQLMSSATDTYFQPEDSSERLRNLWLEKMRKDNSKEREKSAWTAEMFRQRLYTGGEGTELREDTVERRADEANEGEGTGAVGVRDDAGRNDGIEETGAVDMFDFNRDPEEGDYDEPEGDGDDLEIQDQARDIDD
jgi:hypothetical protein